MAAKVSFRLTELANSKIENGEWKRIQNGKWRMEKNSKATNGMLK